MARSIAAGIAGFLVLVMAGFTAEIEARLRVFFVVLPQGPHPQFFFIVLNPLTIKTLGLRSKKEDANFSNLASGSGIRRMRH